MTGQEGKKTLTQYTDSNCRTLLRVGEMEACCEFTRHSTATPPPVPTGVPVTTLFVGEGPAPVYGGARTGGGRLGNKKEKICGWQGSGGFSVLRSPSP